VFRTLKIILGKDPLNPSTLFNPFKNLMGYEKEIRHGKYIGPKYKSILNVSNQVLFDKKNWSYKKFSYRVTIRWSILKVFFKNLAYELFWRNWWRNDQEQLASLYIHSKSLESRIDKLEKEYASQLKWTRL
jgi:hypothetical protein